MLSRIHANGFIHAVLTVCMVVSSLTPYAAFADERDDLRKQMQSIQGAPVQNTPAPDAELVPPPTVSQENAESFEQKDESKGLYETYVGENGTPYFFLASVWLAYEGQRLYTARANRLDFKSDLNKIRAQFPSEEGKPSVPPALAKQLEKIEQLEKRMSGNLGSIQSRESRIEVQKQLGTEVCQQHLGLLAATKDAAMRTLGRGARALRVGGATPKPDQAVVANEQQFIDALRADQVEFAQAYDQWRTEILKYNELVNSVGSRSTGWGKFKVPAPSNQLMKAEGAVPDHQTMRDAINRVNRFLTKMEERTMRGARPALPIRVAQSTVDGARTAANAVGNAAWQARNMMEPSRWPDMMASGMRSAGSAIASGVQGTYGIFRHPYLSYKAGMYGARRAGGAALSYLNTLAKGTLNFVGRNSVRVALLSATVMVNMNINSRLAAKDSTYAETTANIAKQSANAQVTEVSEELDAHTLESTIYNVADVWRQLTEKKLITADPKANIYIDSEGDPIVEGNLNNMADAIDQGKKLKAEFNGLGISISQFEGMWIVIYSQGLAAQGQEAPKPEERLALLSKIYEDHKAEIQPLAVEYEDSAGARALASEALKQRDAEIKTLKEQIAAQADAEKKAAQQRAADEEQARAVAAALAAARNAEAAKTKPPEKLDTPAAPTTPPADAPKPATPPAEAPSID